MAEKVVVGLSGGVDSSVAAYLLKQQGYEVIGVTMEMWRNPDERVAGKAIEDARAVANHLGIPFYVLDFRKEFRRDVMDYFVSEYMEGRTPNPCIVCNRKIKWEALYQRSKELGADYVATGHYARINRLANGRYAIQNSKTARKDQTYVLYELTQEQLAHTLMPLGDYEKDEIRQIAADAGIPVAAKKDSQDVCFIPDNDYVRFLTEELQDRLPGEGNFLWKDGTVVGRHKGYTNYTIGQRKGLQIALGKPVFVLSMDTKKNEVVLGDNADLFTTHLEADHINYMAEETLDPNKTYLGKIRYSHSGTPCHVRVTDGVMQVEFEEEVRAITPGQGFVLYDGDYIAAGGRIL